MRWQVGMGGMECYEEDFEKFLLTETGAYYKLKAAVWIEQDSCPDYMQKADECLQKEEERVENYLHSSTKVGKRAIGWGCNAQAGILLWRRLFYTQGESVECDLRSSTAVGTDKNTGWGVPLQKCCCCSGVSAFYL